MSKKIDIWDNQLEWVGILQSWTSTIGGVAAMEQRDNKVFGDDPEWNDRTFFVKLVGKIIKGRDIYYSVHKEMQKEIKAEELISEKKVAEIKKRFTIHVAEKLEKEIGENVVSKALFNNDPTMCYWYEK